MEQYAIYCTPEITRKALELGAPIEKICFALTESWQNKIPTAEQMICWLEEQEAFNSIEIDYDKIHKVWIYYLVTFKEEDFVYKSLFPSRNEATLAAIDAALEYLANNK